MAGTTKTLQEIFYFARILATIPDVIGGKRRGSPCTGRNWRVINPDSESEKMTYEVYSISGAPRPWRVMLGFVAKGLAFDIRNLETSKQQHKAPEFLALNPRGRVPVLKNGEFILSESIAILSHLDKVHPEPPLFGTSTEEHARIWQLVCECDDYCNKSANALLGPIFRQQNETNEEVKSGATAVHFEFKRLEQMLEGSRFLCAERMTAADCMYFPYVRLVLRATERFPELMQRLQFHPFDKRYPRLSAWVSRIEALPDYEKTFPSHWRPS
jgi:glutathione S-transferase